MNVCILLFASFCLYEVGYGQTSTDQLGRCIVTCAKEELIRPCCARRVTSSKGNKGIFAYKSFSSRCNLKSENLCFLGGWELEDPINKCRINRKTGKLVHRTLDDTESDSDDIVEITGEVPYEEEGAK